MWWCGNQGPHGGRFGGVRGNQGPHGGLFYGSVGTNVRTEGRQSDEEIIIITQKNTKDAQNYREKQEIMLDITKKHKIVQEL